MSAAALLLAAALSLPVASLGQSYEVLHAFSADGNGPQSPLLQASDGNFYGTTTRGGAFDSGTIFRIDSGGNLTILHSFSGSPADGWGPQAGLIQATDGDFYGTTFEDSAGNCCGTVFKFDPTEKLTTLYAFTPGSAYPTARLIEASDGYFYGTTSSDGLPDHGGPNGGTIFRMDALGNLTTLHNFAGNDGSGLYAGLLQASDGSFYGVAESGGSVEGGAIFRLSFASPILRLPNPPPPRLVPFRPGNLASSPMASEKAD